MIVTIISAFAPLFLMVGAIGILAVVIRSAWFKGWLGELEVNLVSRWGLDKRHYHLIKNVTIPTEDGTTQIDHVIVSVYGVFVVETKNLRGWIFGSERERTWTQKLFKKAFKFQNPLHQNFKHTQTLAGLLGLPADRIISVIVFISDGDFKTVMPPNVTRGWRFIRFIKGHTTPILTEDQVQAIIMQIAEQRLAPGLRTHLKHIKHVRQIVAEKGTGRPTVVTPRHDSQSHPIKTVGEVPTPAVITTPTDGLTKSNDSRPVVTSGGTTGMWDMPSPLPVQEALAEEVKAPVCPLCGGAMVLRLAWKSTHAGDHFWGCKAYPSCRGIVPFSSHT